MKESYKKILVAVDLSEQARRAFQEAITLSLMMEIQKLKLLLLQKRKKLI